MADNTGNVMYASDPFLALQLQHSDIRYSVAEKAGDIKQDMEHNFAATQRDMANHANHLNTSVLENTYRTTGELGNTIRAFNDKVDARLDVVSDQVQSRLDSLVGQTDRLFLHQDDQLTSIAKDVAKQNGELTTAIAALSAEVRANADKSAQLSEISTLKSTIEMQKGNQLLSEKIGNEGERTRELINSLKVSDLERLLIERSNELHTERHHGWHHRGMFENAQYASLVSQINNMNSQLSETRQGVNNFGLMSGVGMSSTNNSVR